MLESMGFKNTHTSGSVRNLIFREGATWFGVALELNIVESGDSPQEVMLLLDEAVRGYVEGARKAKLSFSVLNQSVDPEYEKLWDSGGTKGSSKKATEVYSASTQSLAALAA